ncbi:Uncharacterised protein [Mycobacteroides abscessus subsp. massiliense]|nr:Uncharacterised protein [Mycobacteroides abscessus subsp. massiliense]SKU71288.1 Uncharacterised protein [Mycobacteroides abscessus subsp. massiliense]
MLQGVVVSTLQLPQQLRRRGGRTNSGSHRHRVDQQTHHRFGTEHLGRPTRNRGTERHITVPTQRTQQQRPRTLQHHIDRRLLRTRQLCQRSSRPQRHPEQVYAAPAELQLLWRAEECGHIESGHRLAPRVLGRNLIAFGKPGDKAAIRGRRGKPHPVISGEDLLHEDRHRPAIQHDVMIREHEPVPVVGNADEDSAESGLFGEIADSCTLGGAYLFDLFFSIGICYSIG